MAAREFVFPALKFSYRYFLASILIIFISFLTAERATAQSAYISDRSGTVSVIDTISGALTAKIPVGQSPGSIAISPDATKVYVLNSLDQTISVIDAGSKTVISTFALPVSTFGIHLTPDGSQLYLVGASSGYITVMDVVTHAVVRLLDQFSASIASLSFSPDGSKVYVTNNFNIITVVDTVSGSTLQTITMSAGIADIAITPDGKKAYVTPINSGTLYVIDLTTSAVKPAVNLGGGAQIIISADGSRAYVANSSINTIIVLDTATDALLSTINVTSQTLAIALTPDGSRLYVEPFGDIFNLNSTTPKTITIFNTATDQVAGTVQVASEPSSTKNFIGVGSSPLVASILPGGRSVLLGNQATVFATMLNTGANTLQNCRSELLGPSGTGITLAYQTTDPATNASTGQPNTPPFIAASGSQSFILAFSGSATRAETAIPILFKCDGVGQAATFVGVNTIDLAFSTAPVADIIALAATASGDGILTVPVNGSSAFAAATFNVGVAGVLNASVDFGTSELPAKAVICQTNPTTGQCLSAAAQSIPVTIAANATPTFSVFVSAADFIPFAPATSRAFIRFIDGNGGLHGSTSVAIRSGPIDPNNPPVPGPTYAGSFSGVGMVTSRKQMGYNFLNCSGQDTYDGSITVSFTPASVGGTATVSGTWTRQFPGDQPAECSNQNFSTSLAGTAAVVVSGSTVRWVTSATNAVGESLVGTFQGTLSDSGLSGTLVEVDNLVTGTGTIPVKLVPTSQH